MFWWLIAVVFAAEFTQNDLNISVTQNARNSSLVDFQVKAPKEIGWIGLGIGSGMLDGDMIVAWRNADGKVTIGDYHSNARTTPSLDNQQDVINPQAKEQGNSVLFSFTRALDTGDAQDKRLSAGENNFFWATSTDGPQSNDLRQAELEYHGPAKGSFKLNLELKAVDLPPPETKDKVKPPIATPRASALRVTFNILFLALAVFVVV